MKRAVYVALVDGDCDEGLAHGAPCAASRLHLGSPARASWLAVVSGAFGQLPSCGPIPAAEPVGYARGPACRNV